ncbi:uncharacterized protein MONOS_11185 [Monocercomonoides exilis]|uniref:uncharacterized protein n=1 Tax=Monocercomonoides exilis TaxID=2049356 RepID=UPI00355A717B|nr:hypothetical protein MONOS_11185 [Monocercomonoides exilis]|eukprot:MONOS_11185.1-p1 / transcript=MONOS_11185.1 / gene=MONOS_11185 / organism=Monocercomonoides_exilis_PA203 / gene_product=unspecified product / transcript_product=unspecified product / location=Mono_scaffold00547:34943-38446(-) / protein_length=1000 / sequence_SO=supercontig / SO=protein_coding / is_pseudo=false
MYKSQKLSVFPPTGSQINPRYSPLFQYFVSEKGKPSIFVYGGTTYNDVILSDAYVITLDHVFVTPAQVPLESKKPLVKFFAQFKVNNTFFIWGGWKVTGFSNTLWSFDFSLQVWKEVDQGDSIPEARYSMAYASDDNKLYIFGGISASGLLNDLWEFDTQTKKWKVIKINSNENGPKRCSGAGMFISNGYAVVFGGDTEGDDVYDFNMFRIKIDAAPQSWEEVKITDLDGNNKNIPLSRSNFGHATRVISNETFLYIFGVMLGSMEMVKKKSHSKKSNKMTFRIYQSILQKKILILQKQWTEEMHTKKQLLDKDDDSHFFGKTRNKQMFSSFHSSSSNFGANERTEKVSIKAKAETILGHNLLSRINGDPFISLIKAMDFAPSPRVNPIVGFSNGAFFVYGGRDPITGEILSDLHIYVIKLNQWFIQLPEITSETPPARELASYCFKNGSILLFGGLGPNPQTGKVEPSNELWRFSFSTYSWNQLGKNSFAKPYPVFGAACTMYMDYFFVVGGQRADGYINDRCYVFNFALNIWEFSAEHIENFKSSILVRNMWARSKESDNISEKEEKKNYTESADKLDSTINGTKGKDITKTKLQNRKKNSYIDKGKSSDMKQSLLLFGGNVGTTPFYGIFVENIYERFSRTKNGSQTKKNNSSESFSTSGNNHSNNDDVKFKIFNNYDGVASPLDDKIVMLGGRNRNKAKDSLMVIEVFENWTCNATEDNGSFLSNGIHLDVVEAGCTVFDRSVVCFGGRQVSENGTVLPNALDTFRMIRLNDKYIQCSPGTYEDTDGECQLCEPGQFSDEYGNKNCTPCPKGTYGTAFGSQNQQPSPLEATAAEEKWLTIGLYGGSILVGVIIALSFLCLPTKAFLYKLDSYSDKYVDQLDPDTHSTIKHIKKTTFGGFVTIVAFCFVIGAALLVIITFFFFNTSETRSTVDISMVDDADISKISNKNIKVELTLIDYTGECIENGSDNTNELTGKCSENLGLGKTTFDLFGVLAN